MNLEEKIESVREQLKPVEQKISKFQKAIENPGAFSRHKEYYEEKMEELVEERNELYDELDRLEKKKEMRIGPVD